jgi:hypothetical protein
MKDLFAAHDIPCARHKLCSTVAEALAFAEQIGYPLVGKPPAGAGAKATARCASSKELQTFLETSHPGRTGPCCSKSSSRVASSRSTRSRCTASTCSTTSAATCPTPLEVMENPWIQWCVVLPRQLSGPEFAAIHKTGPRALQSLGMWTGMSHMEWFQRGNGAIAIGEVAARPPGAQFMTLMSYVCDTDMYRAFAQLMVFETFAPPARRYSAGAAYLRGQAPKDRRRRSCGRARARRDAAGARRPRRREAIARDRCCPEHELRRRRLRRRAPPRHTGRHRRRTEDRAHGPHRTRLIHAMP